jgi:hypothetical protein
MIKNILWSAFAIFILLLAGNSDSKAQELQFQYDAAGNQIVRQWVCINCTPFPVAFASKEPDESGLPEVIKPESAIRKIVAYPNPLNEVLNLKWSYSSKYYVTQVQVFSPTGLVVFKQQFSKSNSPDEQTSIPFQRQTPGTYLVNITYSDGKQVVVTAVKLQ